MACFSGGLQGNFEDANALVAIGRRVVLKRISTSMLPWFADVGIAGRAPMTASPSHFSWKSPNGDAYPTPRLALARRDFRPVPRRSRSEGSLPARAGRTRCGQAQAAAASL